MVAMEKRPISSFSLPLPKGRGKNKNKIATLNEVPKWHWSSVSKVKNDYKDLIKDWYLEDWNKEPLGSMTVVFSIERHNKRILDSDNIGFIIKWVLDAIKETGTLVDDDQITYTVNPSIVVEGLVESQIKVECYS